MVEIKKFSATAALAVGLSLNLHGAAYSQSLNGQYKAVLNCAKLPFTEAPLENEPVDLKISNGKVTYSRTLYAPPNRKNIIGRETGTGTIAAEGTITLAGGWKGRRDTLKASYSGKLSGGEASLIGKHIVIYQGQSYDRSCTLTVKRR